MAYPAKFKKGDKVRINIRKIKDKHLYDLSLLKGLHQRTRTIAVAYFSPTEQHIIYGLGSKGKHPPTIWLRAEALTLAPSKLHKRGQPRKRREWGRK